MVFLGVAKMIVSRVMDAQAEYVALLASGRINLPSQTEMMTSLQNRISELQAKGRKLIHLNIIEDKNLYFGNLTQQAGITRVPPVLIEMRDINAASRLKDLMSYRDYEYNVIDDFKFERRLSRNIDLTCPFEA